MTRSVAMVGNVEEQDIANKQRLGMEIVSAMKRAYEASELECGPDQMLPLDTWKVWQRLDVDSPNNLGDTSF